MDFVIFPGLIWDCSRVPPVFFRESLFPVFFFFSPEISFSLSDFFWSLSVFNFFKSLRSLSLQSSIAKISVVNTEKYILARPRTVLIRSIKSR